MTHYNCHNPKHKGGTCCDCDPKKDCIWEHSEDKPKQTPDRIDILWKRLNRQGRYADKPIKYTEFRACIDKVVEEVIGKDEKITDEEERAWTEGEENEPITRNNLRAEQRQRYKDMKEKG